VALDPRLGNRAAIFETQSDCPLDELVGDQ
jgi:hypothetical protein